ncbi:type I restriction enzyme M protein [Granulicatella balaenopterae]|uniref:Type I restriction enzyme M protein n=1 Tax=Granulicatella balaenopterae TaxID=137733 RepID=A0A1H9IWX5_9LACT|nr:type I restriction enzyme M protein [Granulicatella balaenopterae]
MLGAIIGDIAGSIYEFDPIKTKNFELMADKCFVTDDTIMTLAVAQAILTMNDTQDDLSQKAIEWMQYLGRKYPDCGYGDYFKQWLKDTNPIPYNSFGNGSAMRVSPCALAADSLEEALDLAEKVTIITHNHPEGLIGAKATVAAIYLAKSGKSLNEIQAYIHENYYRMDFTIDAIREDYHFSEICQETVPQALMCVFESVDFCDAIRNAVSLGGDSDTLAAIAGGFAQAYYGVPKDLGERAKEFLDDSQLEILNAFEATYQNR